MPAIIFWIVSTCHMYIYRVCLFFLLIFLVACDYSKTSDTQQLKNLACEAGLPCTFPNGVKVWLSDGDLSPETPFSIFAELPKGHVITNAKLEGVTMYMGYIPQQFKRHGNTWQSETMVGICAEKNMLWKLILNVTDEATQQSNSVYYYFYVTY